MQSALFGPSYVDLSIFLTMGFIISSFGLPIVLQRAGIVSETTHFMRMNIQLHWLIFSFLIDQIRRIHFDNLWKYRSISNYFRILFVLGSG